MAVFAAQVITDLTPAKALKTAAQQRSVTTKALRKGAKPIAKAIKADAPKVTGTMRRAQGHKVRKGRKGKSIAFAVIGARTKVQTVTKKLGWTERKHVPALIQHLVEKGTKPHPIKRKVKGKTIVFRHPGAKPKPHMGPGFERSKDEAGRIVAAALVEETHKTLARNAARAFKKFR